MEGDLSALSFPLTYFTTLGITDDNLEGTIFSAVSNDYTITSAGYSTSQTSNLQFLITVTCAGQTLVPATVTLNHAGVWTS